MNPGMRIIHQALVADSHQTIEMSQEISSSASPAEFVTTYNRDAEFNTFLINDNNNETILIMPRDIRNRAPGSEIQQNSTSDSQAPSASTEQNGNISPTIELNGVQLETREETLENQEFINNAFSEEQEEEEEEEEEIEQENAANATENADGMERNTDVTESAVVMENANVSKNTDATRKTLRYKRKKCCWNCKERGHTRSECTNPTKQFCSVCEKEGVLTRDCHPQGIAVEPNQSAPPKMRMRKDNQYFLPLRIGRRKFKAFIDTGSNTSEINTQTAILCLQSRWSAVGPNSFIILPGGTRHTITKSVRGSFKLAGQKLTETFQINETLEHQILIGTDILKKLNVKLTFKGRDLLQPSAPAPRISPPAPNNPPPASNNPQPDLNDPLPEEFLEEEYVDERWIDFEDITYIVLNRTKVCFIRTPDDQMHIIRIGIPQFTLYYNGGCRELYFDRVTGVVEYYGDFTELED